MLVPGVDQPVWYWQGPIEMAQYGPIISSIINRHAMLAPPSEKNNGHLTSYGSSCMVMVKIHTSGYTCTNLESYLCKSVIDVPNNYHSIQPYIKSNILDAHRA